MSPPASADSLALARRLHKGRATARRIDTTHLLHLSLPVRDVHRSQHFYARYFGFRAEDAGAVRAYLARLAADKVSIAGHHEAEQGGFPVRRPRRLPRRGVLDGGARRSKMSFARPLQAQR
jgi:catechol 2,3-dioxygenase-like lactoylglutathione lyase family enzyme